MLILPFLLSLIPFDLLYFTIALFFNFSIFDNIALNVLPEGSQAQPVPEVNRPKPTLRDTLPVYNNYYGKIVKNEVLTFIYWDYCTNIFIGEITTEQVSRDIDNAIDRLAQPNFRTSIIGKDVLAIKYLNSIYTPTGFTCRRLKGLSNGDPMDAYMNAINLNITQRAIVVEELRRNKISFDNVNNNNR